MSEKTDWTVVSEQYPIGRNITGKVKKVWKYGARIEIESDLEGIVKNSELIWDKLIDDAHEFLHEGQEVEVQVLRVEQWKKRLFLSIKRIKYDPWVTHSHEYTLGRTVFAKVINFARDVILTEFEDHIIGVLPRNKVIPWSVKAEKILELGDNIEAKVIEIDEIHHEIIISMSDRYQEIEREINVIHQEEFKQTIDWEEATGNELDLEDSIERGPLRILLAEDKEDERFQLLAILQDLGYEEIEEVANEDDAVEMVSKNDYDLILMDVKMSDGELRETGLRAVKRIIEKKPDVSIALVTGDLQSKGMIESQKLGIIGMIKKPLKFEEIRVAMERFNKQKIIGWPETQDITLTGNLPDEVRFFEDITRASQIARPLSKVLHSILEKLKTAANADAVAIFSWYPSTKEVSLVTSINIQDENYNLCKRNLNRSPVTDLIYEPEHPIFTENIDSQAYGKFYFLRPILGPIKDGEWPLQSCIGEHIEVGNDLAYTLFLFGKRKYQFDDNHRILVRATAAVAGSAIREHWIIEKVAAERRLTSLGGLLTSTAHELKGRLSVMEAVGTVARNWQQVRSQPELLNDTSFIQKMDERINRLRFAKEAMDHTVEMILGWVREDKETRIDIKHCLENAINACTEEAKRGKVIIKTDYNSIPFILANPTELEQVFINVLLNAIQQMNRSWRRAGMVTIKIDYNPEEVRPIKIRFIDTGPGIHSRFLEPDLGGEEKIFQPMFSTKLKGTGMGLYISRGLLGNMGGIIRVENTAILIGTTFLIELPETRSKRNG